MSLPCLKYFNASPFCLENKFLNIASTASYNRGPVSPLRLHVSRLLSSYPELLPNQTSCSPGCVMAVCLQALSTALYTLKLLPASLPLFYQSDSYYFFQTWHRFYRFRNWAHFFVVCLFLCYLHLTDNCEGGICMFFPSYT